MHVQTLGLKTAAHVVGMLPAPAAPAFSAREFGAFCASYLPIDPIWSQLSDRGLAMDELPDFLDENYDPAAVMERVDHLPHEAQQDIEQISRILRAAFGYDETEMPADGRIVSVALIGPSADRQSRTHEPTGYDFHIMVNLPECADDGHWRFARRLIASEIGPRPVTLTVSATGVSAGIILYDAETDFPLNARELSLRP